MKMNLTVLLIATLMSGSVLAAGEVVYVDLQKAVQGTKAGAKAKKDLEAEVTAKKKKIQSKEDELKKMQEELEKKSLVLSDDMKAQKQKAFQERMFEYQKLVQESQVALQKREQELTKPILEKLGKVIEQLAKEKGYAMVMERGPGLVWAKKDLDITEQVVQTYEKK